jgi:hypothetical protein
MAWAAGWKGGDVGMNVHTYSYLKDSHQKVFKTEKATL